MPSLTFESCSYPSFFIKESMEIVKLILRSGNVIIGYTSIPDKTVKKVFFTEVPTRPSFMYCYCVVTVEDGDTTKEVIKPYLFQDRLQINPVQIRKIDLQ